MRKRTVRILTALAIFVVALALIYAIAVGISAVKLSQAYTALKQDGRPMEMADITPPPVPYTQNAAPLYESAILLLQAQPAAKGDLLADLGALSIKYVEGTLDPNEEAQFRQLMPLDAVARALQTVEQGATRSACQFRSAYDRHGYPAMPNLNELRALAYILAAKMLLEAEDGQMERAWDMATTQLGFADALRTERSYLVSQLVRAGQISLACRTIQRLCNSAVGSEQQSQPIQTRLESLDDITPLLPTADAERLEGERIFNLPKEELWQECQNLVFSRSYVPEILLRLRFYKLTFKPLFLADHAAYLRLMHGYAKLLEQPYERHEADAFEKLHREIAPGHPLAERLAPAMGRVREIYLRMIAETRVTRAGLALLQYRKTHGAFPDTLDALDLPHAQDPFSLKPLVYAPQAQGFVLYSIGPDQKDNGGTPRPRRGNAEYDLVWHFPSQQAD